MPASSEPAPQLRRAVRPHARASRQPRSAGHADLGASSSRWRRAAGDRELPAVARARPGLPVALANYAVVLRGAGRSREALPLRQGLALEPDDPGRCDVAPPRSATSPATRRRSPPDGPWRWREAMPRPGSAAPSLASRCGATTMPRALLDQRSLSAPFDASLARARQHHRRKAPLRGACGYDKSLALDPQMADAWRGGAVLTAQEPAPRRGRGYKLLAVRPEAGATPGRAPARQDAGL
jgi:hypothetical protein